MNRQMLKIHSSHSKSKVKEANWSNLDKKDQASHQIKRNAQLQYLLTSDILSQVAQVLSS